MSFVDKKNDLSFGNPQLDASIRQRQQGNLKQSKWMGVPKKQQQKMQFFFFKSEMFSTNTLNDTQ